MSPEQRVYTKIRKIIEDKGYDVYDFLPSRDVSYPFVVLGNQFIQNIKRHKYYTNKHTQPTIHFWINDPGKRGTLTKMMSEIEIEIIKEFELVSDEINSQVIQDNSTRVMLLHGILEPNIRI